MREYGRKLLWLRAGHGRLLSSKRRQGAAIHSSVSEFRVNNHRQPRFDRVRAAPYRSCAVFPDACGKELHAHSAASAGEQLLCLWLHFLVAHRGISVAMVLLAGGYDVAVADLEVIAIQHNIPLSHTVLMAGNVNPVLRKAHRISSTA
jgi:hypothetical protein